MIITKKQYMSGELADDYINPFTDVKVAGNYISLFESIEESTIDYDVQKYHDVVYNCGPVEYLGMTFPDTFNSDIIILKKILEFKGKKFVLIKNDTIACVFEDLNFLIRSLVEMDKNRIGSWSPVNTILDADTGQAIFLHYTDPNHVHCNF